MSIDDTLITVATCAELIQADMIKSRLEAEGIAVVLFGEHHVQMNWLHSLFIGGVRIQVRKSEGKKAREILALLKQSALSLPEDAARCPKCGAAALTRKRAVWKFAFISLFFAALPLPFTRFRVRCVSCGHTWKTLEKVDAP